MHAYTGSPSLKVTSTFSVPIPVTQVAIALKLWEVKMLVHGDTLVFESP